MVVLRWFLDGCTKVVLGSCTEVVFRWLQLGSFSWLCRGGFRLSVLDGSRWFACRLFKMV